MQHPSVKLSYSPTKTLRPIYTQGSVAVSLDGRYLATTLNTQAVVYDLQSNALLAKTASDSSTLSSLCWAGHSLVTSSSSNTITIYSLATNGPYLTPTRIINKAHDSPILVSAAEPSSCAFLATGSADGVVKVWDLKRGYTTHVFKGHAGPVSSLCWRRQASSFQLITGSTDTHIRIWDLNESAKASQPKPKYTLQGHVSIVRGLALSDDNILLSGARDRVVLKWDISSTPKLLRTFPTLSSIESVGILPDGDSFFTAGEGGLKTYAMDSGEEMQDYGGGVVKSTRVDNDDNDGVGGLADAQLTPSSIMSVGHDQIITFHQLDNSPPQHIIGYPDQIISAVYVSETDIAISTNAPQIFIISKDSLPFTTQILEGHTDTILSLKAVPSKGLLLSGSKDGSVRVWKRYNGRFECIAIGSGHGESVGAVAVAPQSTNFAISASQDRLIKVWDLTPLQGLAEAPATPVTLSSYITQRIHEKDINSLDISPDDRYLATGSQDRTAKVFDVTFDTNSKRSSVKLKATIKAHKRGVWAVKFSNYDRIFATAGGDKSVKLWSLKDFSCIKTLEGHTNSVLDLAFLSNGQQLLTSAADGLIKLWNLKTEECVSTLDGHEDKVWALDISPDDSECISGGGDSLLTFWQDATQHVEDEAAQVREEGVVQDETLANLIQVKDYKSAISLAISMNQPRRLYQLFEGIRKEAHEQGTVSNALTGNASVDGALKQLDAHDLRRLLLHIRTWNANNKTSHTAQLVLHAILRLRSSVDIRKCFDAAREADEEKGRDPGYDAQTGEFVPHTVQAENAKKRTAEENASLKEIIEGLIPYTERHLSRADRMVTESYVVDFILQEMDGLDVMDGVSDGASNAMEVDVA